MLKILRYVYWYIRIWFTNRKLEREYKGLKIRIKSFKLYDNGKETPTWQIY